MKTAGRRIDDMTVSEQVGMKFALGENPKSVYNGKGQTPMTRMGTARTVSEDFEKVMGKKPGSFRDFVRANRDVW